ncbi:hypothetical protein Tsubulata_021459 [Turnera subulata]|uniref:F-box associated domain-containing protein n=1 Tax=Turnera subulata TaxID=218843 RepID=A0A9Q0FYQ9_9ROSI|nr:hypothetical protein Tsubulata_021459 [Turnera subulata]
MGFFAFLLIIWRLELLDQNHHLTQLLLFIPAKSLLRFQCVSKVKTMAFHNLRPPIPYLPQPITEDVVVPFLDYLNMPRVKILQCCNGLLLCSSSYLLHHPGENSSDENVLISYMDYSASVTNTDGRGFRFFICNPTTRQFKKLSLPARAISDGMWTKLNLAFDPSNSPHYKVICIHSVTTASFGAYELIDVYSSQTGSWNPLGTLSNRPRGLMLEFWSLLFYILESLGVFAYGDLFGLPPSSLEFNIWEMAADRSSWFLRYCVDLKCMEPPIPVE